MMLRGAARGTAARRPRSGGREGGGRRRAGGRGGGGRGRRNWGAAEGGCRAGHGSPERRGGGAGDVRGMQGREKCAAAGA